MADESDLELRGFLACAVSARTLNYFARKFES